MNVRKLLIQITQSTIDRVLSDWNDSSTSENMIDPESTTPITSWQTFDDINIHTRQLLARTNTHRNRNIATACMFITEYYCAIWLRIVRNVTTTSTSTDNYKCIESHASSDARVRSRFPALMTAKKANNTNRHLEKHRRLIVAANTHNDVHQWRHMQPKKFKRIRASTLSNKADWFNVLVLNETTQWRTKVACENHIFHR